jgi:DNA-binding winged helix-turn-helix (wHTH) protein
LARFRSIPGPGSSPSDSREVDLSPRLVEILAFIVSRSGEIVTKEELLEKFWPEVNVSENTLTRAIADIRKAIGEDAASPRFLQTVSRRGYKFGGEAGVDYANHRPVSGLGQRAARARFARCAQAERSRPGVRAGDE